MATSSVTKWSDIDPEHEQELTRIAARYVRWPHPDLVAQVAEANQVAPWHHECRDGLASAGIDPELYLWAGSTCLFPGTRRFKNSRTPNSPEKPNGRCAPGAVVLDSGTNTKAKQVWTSLVGSFNKQRNGYHLVHLFPHQGQEVGNILQEEHAAEKASPELLNDARQIGLPGLYTSAANMCFMPGELTRPTDASSLLRQVLWQKALDLYGTQFLPPILRSVADSLKQELLPDLEWTALCFGKPITAARWKTLDTRRQQWFRGELAKWKAAQPTCL